jgi:Na+/melibiose symporter-like transporter
MKSILTSFWFWLFIIGIALILLAALIGGGMKKVTGWIWALFIVGVVLALLGVIFAFVAIRNAKPCVEERNELPCPNLYSTSGEPIGCPLAKKSQNYNYASPNVVNSPNNINNAAVSPNKVNSPNKANSAAVSPLGTPTLVSSNIPQAQRGFATTSLNISALAPAN